MPDLRAAARPIEDLPDLVGGARLVLLGEASHGTHEFYALRAELTRRLVAEGEVRAVAVEADWPAAARVNHYVQRCGDDRDAEEALGDFARFPRWMWRNRVIVELVEWLRDQGRGTGFYGLDLYSLRESMGAVVAQLRELRDRAAELAARDGRLPRDAHFAAEQNARLAAAAERSYRAMYRARESSWNLRDTHMADTLDALRGHLDGGRILVWAHNSHLGDARATSMGAEHGEVNLGQLARERHGDDVCIVGFTTHAGTVTAARDWDRPAERRHVRPSLPDSVERLLHDAGVERGVLDLGVGGVLAEERPQRMIGVIYRPQTERRSHYLRARAAEQFDLLVHVDETTALEPLEAWSSIEEPAETYPFGL